MLPSLRKSNDAESAAAQAFSSINLPFDHYRSLHLHATNTHILSSHVSLNSCRSTKAVHCHQLRNANKVNALRTKVSLKRVLDAILSIS
jgi:hypothetical protein